MSKKKLENINSPVDLRALSIAELEPLAQELRDFIIEVVSVKRGHLGASLGVVELTIAIHYVFDTPHDLLVWDVGHQAYPHKILTGRREIFHTNRQLNGISGFPKMAESEYDCFGTGHSSTSISATLGMAMASKLKGDDQKQHIAVIGDASIASGMAFEGLNHAGVTSSNLLVILNDNEMGIDPNVGALKNYLTSVKRGGNLDQQNIFEALDFLYAGPVDGHDLKGLVKELSRLKSIEGPKLLHVITRKGKGLLQAERDQVTYHAPGKFDKTSGELIQNKENDQAPRFQDVFGLTLVELAELNDNIIGITPAMPTGSSLKYMIERFPERAFDVGIAEQHAVTLAAGFATQGMIPFCTIYSTFIQRAYDQIIHDVALQKLPVIFCIDRAGLVGEDGATHHGVFDLAFLRCIPNMTIFAPMDELELRNMMFTAQQLKVGPIAIRYPRGKGTHVYWRKKFELIDMGKGRCLRSGTHMAVLSLGHIGEKVNSLLASFEEGKISHYDMRFLKPLDTKLLEYIFSTYNKILTIEEGTVAGGFGSAVLEYANTIGKGSKHIKCIGLKDRFIDHGTMDELYAQTGLDKKSIQLTIEQLLNKKI